MARKSGRNRNQKSEQPDQLDTQPFPGFWGWVTSFLLLISTADGGPFQTVRVLPPVADAALTPEWAWQAPASTLDSLWLLAECPYWLYAAVVSFLISRFLRIHYQNASVDRAEPGVAPLALAALSLPIVTIDLATIVVFIGATALLVRPLPHEKFRSISIVFVAAAALAVVLCVDFSIPLILLFAGWWRYSHQLLSNRQMVAVSACLVIVLISGLVTLPGFAAAFARPVTWLAVDRNSLPMSPLLNDKPSTWFSFLLTTLVVIHSWSLVWRSDRRTFAQIVSLLFFSVLALNCRYYQWLALLGVVSFSGDSPPARRIVLPRPMVKWGLATVVLLSLSSKFESYRSFVLTGHWPQQFADPAEWETSGRVVLMRPESSPRWQTARLRKNFRLMIDTRWDLFSKEYRDYQLVCRDLSEFRSSSYLRSDGTWGGYRRWINEWKPSLLVVDSSDLDAIRRVSLSPDWNVVGIDSFRTIFAAADKPENMQQIRRAGRLLSELEWPTSQFDGSYGNVIVASGHSASLKVAEILLAMRLPYAALRVLPETVAPGNELVARCHFEISHRVFRHTQQHSLLDQYRAVSNLKKIAEGNQQNARQLIRIARGLETLGEIETAAELAGQLVEQYRSSNLPERQWATELMDRCQSRVIEPPAMTDPELSIRQAFLSGDERAVKKRLTALDDNERAFFTVLSESNSKSPEDIYYALIDLVNTGDLPTRLHAEALFYLGSLAIEAGDSTSAINAFSASIEAAPASPLNAISRTSLRNLQKESR